MVKLEKELKNLILKNVEFRIENKVLKKGLVKVFNTKQFFIKFKLDTQGDIKEYELPYPYKIHIVEDGYLFDYCLSAFVPKTEDVYYSMITLNKKDASKLHEKYLHIALLSP